MFGALDDFQDRAYFDQRRSGTIMTCLLYTSGGGCKTMIKKRIMAAVIALLLIVNVSPMSLVAYAESDMGTEEVTLSASPDTLTCIITFDMCGHGESIEAVEAEAGACIDKPLSLIHI